MPNHIDKELIRGCIDNDRRSHNELYKQLFSFLMNICMRYKKDYNDAGASLNAIFLKIVLRLSDFDTEKSILPWVKTIAIRHLIDEFRVNSKRMETSMDDFDFVETNFSSNQLDKLKADDILQMVRELPETVNQVFNLYVIDGFIHKEIGDMLNMTESTSKWYLAKARKALQEKLLHENNKAFKTKAL